MDEWSSDRFATILALWPPCCGWCRVRRQRRLCCPASFSSFLTAPKLPPGHWTARGLIFLLLLAYIFVTTIAILFDAILNDVTILVLFLFALYIGGIRRRDQNSYRGCHSGAGGSEELMVSWLNVNDGPNHAALLKVVAVFLLTENRKKLISKTTGTVYNTTRAILKCSENKLIRCTPAHHKFAENPSHLFRMPQLRSKTNWSAKSCLLREYMARCQ